MGKTLFEKVWQAHEVRKLDNGQSQLLIGLHLIHEVTSPQAFGMLKDKGLKVAYPERTVATLDHIIPTDGSAQPYADPLAQKMRDALSQHTQDHGIRFFDPSTGHQGIVHVVGPERGLTQPGMTIVCGDSHTATHGAFGAIAFGIGTSQVRDVLATQTLVMEPLKVRKIVINGCLQPGVTAKDVILHVIGLLGSEAGQGYAYEYTGSTIAAMSMEERMTVCNMSIEGGARCGYVNPDETTFAYLKGRPDAPGESDWHNAVKSWKLWASDPDACYDDVVEIDASLLVPTLTYGTSPDQVLTIDASTPDTQEHEGIASALRYMQLSPQTPIKGTQVDVAFIGSCTNGRYSDFEQVARHLKGHRIASHVRALAVPGSQPVAAQAEATGVAQVFRDAGFEWREPGCSMCLAMNNDKLVGDELCVSSSNRNFKGRQGSATGRTVLMSPLMVAACAVQGSIADVREVFSL